MIPGAQGEGQRRANNIGEYVIRVEVAAIGQQSLDYFGADSEACGASDQGEVDATAAW